MSHREEEKMFSSFTVENFRCFKKLHITPLNRVNLIAGKNNVGKTALLEALFLHYGYHNPALGMGIDALRGIQRFRSDELMLNLFCGFDPAKEIKLIAETDDKHRLSLKIVSQIPRQTVATLKPHLGNGGGQLEILDTSQDSTSDPGVEVQFIYKEDDETEIVSTATLTDSSDEIRVDRTPQSGRPAAVFHTAKHRESSEQLAERFSSLAIAREQTRVINTLQLLEPKLKDLTLQHRGGKVMIYGDTGGSRLIPLQLMGDGITRVLSYVLAIPQVRGGAMLIDEVENGLHHSIMSDIWRALAQSARAYDVQLFATTHSSECISAAVQAFESRQDDFQLYRLDRIKDDVKVKSYDFETLSMALELGLETR